MAAFIKDWQPYIRDINPGQVNFIAEMLFIRGIYIEHLAFKAPSFNATRRNRRMDDKFDS
jgi:hypothetical protein